jgi:hypothetical protein
MSLPGATFRPSTKPSRADDLSVWCLKEHRKRGTRRHWLREPERLARPLAESLD